MALTEQVFGNSGTSRGSQNITARGLRFVFEKVGMASIGRPVQPKEFRTFFVQTMVDGGIPIAIAAKMVGHDDPRTTQRHYNALTVERRRVIGEGIPVRATWQRSDYMGKCCLNHATDMSQIWSFRSSRYTS